MNYIYNLSSFGVMPIQTSAAWLNRARHHFYVAQFVHKVIIRVFKIFLRCWWG